METTKFELEIKKLPTNHMINTLNLWADAAQEKHGVFVDITLSNTNQSLHKIKKETPSISEPNKTNIVPITEFASTYNLSGYFIPDKHIDLENWKLAVLDIANNYRKTYEYWYGPNKISANVIFTDKNGLDLQIIKDDESFIKSVVSIKDSFIETEEQNPSEIDEVLR